jgi:hypothetical protein
MALGYKAKQIWEEWFTAQQVQHGQHTPAQPVSALQWQKPPEGWYKCNVDAGFHRDCNKTSGGWCLRDHSGMFVAAGTSWLEGNCSVIEGEAIALLHSMRAMVQRGVSHAIFESDSKSLVDAIKHINNVLLFMLEFQILVLLFNKLIMSFHLIQTLWLGLLSGKRT